MFRQAGRDLDQFALVFFRAKHGHIEQDEGLGGGAEPGAQARFPSSLPGWGEYHGVGNYGDFSGRGVGPLELAVPGLAAVGDYMPNCAKRAPEEPGRRFAGPESGDGGRARPGRRDRPLNGAPPAVRHPTHAKRNLRGFRRGCATETGRQPIEPQVKRLERPPPDRRADQSGQRAARTKRQQRGIMAGRGKGVRQQHGLAFRTP